MCGAYLFLPDGNGRSIDCSHRKIKIIEGKLVSSVTVFCDFVIHEVKIFNCPGKCLSTWVPISVSFNWSIVEKKLIGRGLSSWPNSWVLYFANLSDSYDLTYLIFSNKIMCILRKTKSEIGKFNNRWCCAVNSGPLLYELRNSKITTKFLILLRGLVLTEYILK